MGAKLPQQPPKDPWGSWEGAKLPQHPPEKKGWRQTSAASSRGSLGIPVTFGDPQISFRGFYMFQHFLS